MSLETIVMISVSLFIGIVLGCWINSKLQNVTIQNVSNSFQHQQWEDTPQSFFGWVLWALPEGCWTIVILTCAILFSIFAVKGGHQILTKRQNEIAEKTHSRVEKEKLKLWNSSDNPQFKVELLRIWENQNEVPDKIWKKYGEEKNKSVQVEMAIHPWFPEEMKKKLFYSNNERTRIAAIINTEYKTEAVETLARVRCKNCAYIREIVAENPQTPEDILILMTRDRAYTVHEGLAKNISTPPKILEKLSNDERGDIRINVANNPKTPHEILEKLSKPPYQRLIREGVAQNPNTGANTLKQMCEKETDEIVLDALALNPKITNDFLGNLVKKSYKSVYKIINKRKTFLNSSANSPTENQPTIDQTSKLSEDDQKLLAFSNDEKKRIKVAKYPKALKELLLELANDTSELVRNAVAQNKTAPLDILTKLSKDWKVKVRQSVASNPNTLVKILKRLSVDENLDVRREAISSLISRPQREWSKDYE